MNSRKIVIRTVLVLIGLPIVLVLILFGFFYSVFYFPNWTSATTGTIISSGQKREYLLYVPKSYDRTKPTPLVISLHGAMTWPSSLMAVSQWNLVADENGFIVVYPAGTGFGPKYWDMTGSDTPSRMPDVIFISELIDKLEASYNIDRARIYANGLSKGGGMAFVLSCTLSDRIAAVGMVSAGLDPGWDWCTDHRPVPVIAFHGTADPLCLYNGGYSKLVGPHFRVCRALWRLGLGATSADRIPSNLQSLRTSRACNTRTALTMRTWCSIRSREKAISGPAASE